jgi:hypothetical protein
MTTPCDCPAAGWCPRHKFTTTEHEHNLCRTRPEFFALFASGKSPQHVRERILRNAEAQAAPRAERREPKPDLKPADFPCVHRLAFIEIGKCDVCGLRGQPFDIFGCVLHERCSVGRKRKDTRNCVACDDRAEPATTIQEIAQ